jgi:uncharacterized protein YcbK (DUF882 family)
MGWHVTVKVAHEDPLPLRLTRAGYCSSLAALLIFFGCESLQNATAEGETRTISFHHIHTNEDLTITYKVHGRYDENALTKIDSLLRDWREDKPIRMDPHLIDLLWEVHREVGAKEPIWIICGFRSPSTNASLRRHSSGVAKFSQHMNGKAIDFYIPGVPLDQLRAAGLRAQRGGVGYYPSSGSPFVHLDTGNARHWPRMPEAQLASVLSKGQLASRFASDPRGTALAQGEIQRSSRTPSLLAKLFGSGKDADEEADAAAASTPAPAKSSEPARTAKIEPKVDKAAEKPAVTARAPEPRGTKIAAVPLPTARPLKTEAYQVASATSKPVAKLEADKEIAVAASTSIPAPAGYEMASASAKPVRLAQAGNLLDGVNATANNATAKDVINERGYWQGLPSAESVEVPPINNSRVTPASTATPRRAVATANADPAVTASVARWPLADRSESEPLPNALAYASQPTPIATARAVPMGTGTPRAAPAVHGDTTVVVKRSDDRLLDTPPTNDDRSSGMPSKKLNSSVVRVGDRFNDPWMRAMIVSPSAQSFMKTTLFGMPDFRNLGPYMQKPDTALTMTFADDPHPGMASENFSGSAVTFIASVKFDAPRTTTVR